MSGWIKLHRSCLNHPCLRRPDEKGVWMTFLLQAAHKAATYRFRDQIVQLDRGQLAVSLREEARKGGITHARIRKIVGMFVEHGMLKCSTHPSTLFTVVTICNYDRFQASDEEARTVSAQSAHTEQESKKSPTPNGVGQGKPARTLKGQLWAEMAERLEMPERKARELAGRWVKTHGLAKVFEAHEAAKVNDPADYRAYMFGALKERPPSPGGKRASPGPTVTRPQAGEDDPYDLAAYGPFRPMASAPLVEAGAR